jgi:hypothetical protein
MIPNDQKTDLASGGGNVWSVIDSDMIMTTDLIDKFLLEESQNTERDDPDLSIWYWVMYTALQDYKTLIFLPRKKRQFKEIFNWIFNDHIEEADYLGSYQRVCETLGIDSGYLMKKIIWTEVHFPSSNVHAIQ